MRGCPYCGAENRDQAQFCAVCGKGLPIVHSARLAIPTVNQPMPSTKLPPVITSPPPSNPSLIVPVPQPGHSTSLSPVHQSSVWSQIGWGHPLAEGRITHVDPEREAKMPLDYSRALVLLSFVLLALGLCTALAFVATLIFIVFALVGLSSICLLPLLLPIFYAIVNPILGWLHTNEKTPLVEFQVVDTNSHESVSVILYRRVGSSTVHLGDYVQVYGAKRWGTGNILADRIEVYETSGRPAHHRVAGKRPWPLWIGFMALISVISLYAYLLWQFGVLNLGQ